MAHASPSNRKSAHRNRVPPSVDAAEAVERIVPRRRLKVEDGDVMIVRTHGGFRSLGQDVYDVQIRGEVGRPDRFAGFDRAAAAGEQLASVRKVRVYYVDTEQTPPHLLNDFRPA